MAISVRDFRPPPSTLHRTPLLQLPAVSAMETVPQQPTGREDIISALNAAIATLDLARNNSNVGTAKNIFRSATDILTTARVRFSLFRDDQV